MIFVDLTTIIKMEERSPTSWGRLHSPNPFLTLSNFQIDQNYSSSKKKLITDRFMNEVGSIKCKLNFDSDHDSASN